MLRFFGIASLAIAVLALLFGFAALSLAQSMGAQGAGGSSAGAPIAEPGGGAAIITKLLKTPSGGAAAYTEQVLYDFCSQSNCADGAYPSASLIMDGAGNLYGTTRSGGNSGCGPNCGTVFELVPSGSGWTETVLYNFCSQSNCADGANPSANLIMDGAGN